MLGKVSFYILNNVSRFPNARGNLDLNNFVCFIRLGWKNIDICKVYIWMDAYAIWYSYKHWHDAICINVYICCCKRLVGSYPFVGQSLIIELGIQIQIAVQSAVIMATFIKKLLFTTSKFNDSVTFC